MQLYVTCARSLLWFLQQLHRADSVCHIRIQKYRFVCDGWNFKSSSSGHKDGRIKTLHKCSMHLLSDFVIVKGRSKIPFKCAIVVRKNVQLQTHA